ncbi:MAG: delta-60 repeat domain-containing protein [Flavobacteriales bacterium]|nr:delta-60 repeat domain-containing protein [Flavobacteriales bacterium]
MDTSFDTGTTTYFDVRTALVRADGKIIIGGNFSLTRLNADGSLDASFSTGTAQSIFVWSIAEQNDGRIIIGGNFANAGDLGRNRVARLHADGELDVSFNPGTGSNWYVLASAVQADGKILAGGCSPASMARGATSLHA